MNQIQSMQLKLQEFSDKIKDYMINELKILKRNFDNPNIIKLIDYYQIQEYLIMIMEAYIFNYYFQYCIFDLEYLRQQYYDNNIPEDLVIIILKINRKWIIFFTCESYYSQRFKIRKCWNIFKQNCEKEQINKSQFKNITFKLLDFGLSKILNDTHTNIFLGTPSNVAPEILNDQDYTFKVDIYSLGCCLFRMITGQFPYYDKKVSQVLIKINKKVLNLRIFKILN